MLSKCVSEVITRWRTNLTPVMSRYCPGTKCSARNSVPNKSLIITYKWFENRIPGLSCPSTFTLNSINTRFGVIPCRRKWPRCGLGTRQRSALSAPTWIATSPSFWFWLLTCTTWQSMIWREEKLAIICFFCVVFETYYLQHCQGHILIVFTVLGGHSELNCNHSASENRRIELNK